MAAGRTDATSNEAAGSCFDCPCDSPPTASAAITTSAIRKHLATRDLTLKMLP